MSIWRILAPLAIALLGVQAGNIAASDFPRSPADTAQLVLVIDDIGYNLPLGKRAAELPGAITYGVIPHTPLGKKLAFYAVNQSEDKEIIVHMPMQSITDKALGEGGLTSALSRGEFITTLRQALHEVPFASGLSNHMGSELTARPDRMNWLMQELDRRNYFFLDSKTTSTSHPRDAALDSQVPYLVRDVFLDHDPSPQAIQSAFGKALRLAQQNGLAVVLAHPYPSTLDYLERTLPTLSNRGVELVTAGQALGHQRSPEPLAMAKKTAKSL